MDEDIVQNIIFGIGSFVVTVMILGIPVLLTLSIIFKYPEMIQISCAVATVGIIIGVWGIVYSLHEDYF